MLHLKQSEKSSEVFAVHLQKPVDCSSSSKALYENWVPASISISKLCSFHDQTNVYRVIHNHPLGKLLSSEAIR